MNPNYQPHSNTQLPSPYRNNYHINPAQSKIVYTSPQNIHSGNKNQPTYIVTHSNAVMGDTVQQQNHYVNQNQNHNQNYNMNTGHQIRPHSSSPIGGPQYIVSNPVVVPQNIHQANQSRPNVQPIQPIQNPMLYSFQPIQNVNRQGMIQSNVNPHYGGDKIVQNNLVKSESPMIQNYPPNRVVQPNFVPATYQMNSSGGSGVTFSYKKSDYQGLSMPLPNQHQHVAQSAVVHGNNQIMNSTVHISLNQSVPSQYNRNPVHLNEIQGHHQVVPPHKITESFPPTISQPPVLPVRQDSQFHMTQSLDYDHTVQGFKAPQQNNQQQFHQTNPTHHQQQQPQQLQKVAQIIQANQNQNQTYMQHSNQNQDQPISSPIWQQRFIMIYQKFEWFYQRYDFISRQFTILSQEFQNVNSQDEWLELKEKHDLLLQKIQEIHEQLANTIQQNQQLAQQYELENRNSKQSDQGERVWQHRYHQLLQEYKSLSQNYADLQSQGNNLNTSQSQHSQNNPNKGGMSLEDQAQLQAKFQQLQNQYNVLCQQYEKIRVQYERTYEQNIQYGKQNTQLINNQEQSRNMATQLQAYVQELQQQNDQLRKQQRKSSPSSVNENSIPREEVQKMQYHYSEEIQKYEQQLQKYRMAIDQYEEQAQLSRQELEKVSEIAMDREHRIKELEVSQHQNANSKSSHSNNQLGQQAPQWQKTYINRLEHQIKQSKQNQKQLLYKIQIKDVQRRTIQQKLHYLQRQYQIKKDQLQRLSKNFDQKLLKIQQNTSSQFQIAGSRHIVQEQVTRPISNSQYQLQIHQLQYQLRQLQNTFSSKMNNIKQIQLNVEHYESQLRKQSNQQNITSMEYQKRISQIQIDFGKKIAQKDVKISILTSEIQRLQDTNKTLIKQKTSLKQSLFKQNEQNQANLSSRHLSKITQLQTRIHQKSQHLAQSKQTIQRLEKQLRLRNNDINELRNFVQHLKKGSINNNTSSTSIVLQLQKLRQDLKTKQQTLQRRIQEISKLKREKQYKIKHITQLQRQLQQVNSQAGSKRLQISNLKRQLSDLQNLQSQYQSLKSNFNKKSQQIVQLRQDIFELEKLRMENESYRRDLQRYNSQNKDKHNQIQKLKQDIYQLEKKLSSIKPNQSTHPNITISNPLNQFGSSSRYINQQQRDDSSQLPQLKQSIKKKDNQISRLNQLLQENQYSLENKTRDLEMIKSQLSTLNRSKDSQVSILNHNVQSLQGRLRESQSKRSKLNDQINQLRIKFQDQLKSQSERHKNYYDKVIARHQQDYKSLKEKIRNVQQTNNKQQIQLERAKTIEKTLEIQIKQLNKKITNQQSQVLQKEEIFSTFRLKQTQSQQSTKAVYQKLSSLQLQIKTKQQQLKLSEEKNSILEQKIKKNKKDFENFRNKLIVSQQYQNNNSVVQYLSKRIADYESKMVNQSQHDFGFKVKDQEANHVFENQVVYHLKIQNQILRKQLEGKGIQHDRKVLNQIQEQNLKRSKNLLKNSTFSSKIGNISSQYIMKDNIEDINFYKDKNKQLQQRVQKHLKVNKQLKQKIQTLIKTSSQPRQSQYYKQQISQFEHKIVQLQKKIEILTQENRTMGKNVSKRQSRVQDQYEERTKELESKLIQMTKSIQQLTQQKNQLEISRSQLQMQKKMISDQNQRLNQKISSFNNKKYQVHEEQSKKLRQKCEQYELQITKLSNKCRVLESEIQRLTEMNNSSKQSLNDLNGLKLKITQLTQLFTKSENNLHEQQLRANSLTSDLVSWQQKAKFFQNQIERLNEINELYSKKQRSDLSESSVLKQSTSGIQIQLSTLQNQINVMNIAKTEQQHKMEQLVTQLEFYINILHQIEYHMELLRSGVIEEQTLLEEIVLGRQNVKQCIEGLHANIERNLYCLDQAFRKIKRV